MEKSEEPKWFAPIFIWNEEEKSLAHISTYDSNTNQEEKEEECIGCTAVSCDTGRIESIHVPRCPKNHYFNSPATKKESPKRRREEEKKECIGCPTAYTHEKRIVTIHLPMCPFTNQFDGKPRVNTATLRERISNAIFNHRDRDFHKGIDDVPVGIMDLIAQYGAMCHFQRPLFF
jgi:hypothetical protein